MSIRLYADELRSAIYEEAPGGGDPIDPASLMNRPVIAPLDWLQNIYFHSDLDYYGVAAYNLSVSLTHSAITGATVTNAGGISNPISYQFNSAIQDQLVLTHNLGYVPRFYAVVDGKMAPNSAPVQYSSVNKIRFASVYATTTEIRVHSFGFTDNTTLAATTVTYGVLVFRTPAIEPSLPMLSIDVNSPGVVFGQGKFIGSQPHLRVVGPGDTDFAVATNRTMAIRNGGFRTYLPNGSFFDYGNFNGSLTAPQFRFITAGV